VAGKLIACLNSAMYFRIETTICDFIPAVKLTQILLELHMHRVEIRLCNIIGVTSHLLFGIYTRIWVLCRLIKHLSILLILLLRTLYFTINCDKRLTVTAVQLTFYHLELRIGVQPSLCL